MHLVAGSGKVAQDASLLCILGCNIAACLFQILLLCLSDLVSLLVLLLLLKHHLASFETLDFRKDRLQSLRCGTGGVGKNALYHAVVGVENQSESIWHLCIEAHA